MHGNGRYVKLENERPAGTPALSEGASRSGCSRRRHFRCTGRDLSSPAFAGVLFLGADKA
jgi:hypothetical protein